MVFGFLFIYVFYDSVYAKNRNSTRDSFPLFEKVFIVVYGGLYMSTYFGEPTYIDVLMYYFSQGSRFCLHKLEVKRK